MNLKKNVLTKSTGKLKVKLSKIDQNKEFLNQAIFKFIHRKLFLASL